MGQAFTLSLEGPALVLMKSSASAASVSRNLEDAEVGVEDAGEQRVGERRSEQREFHLPPTDALWGPGDTA